MPHAVVRDHLETFLAEVAARSDGTRLPDFVEREFRDFLGCGMLALSFARPVQGVRLRAARAVLV